MEQRRLGKTDMVASVLGFGGSEIGYQRVSGRTVARLLGSALDAGLNVIDTAECYEDSEVLIGRALGPDRKSTRLNSSHGYISYAVFCLKKKKRIHSRECSDIITNS